jgi:hypothetical protein
MLENTPNILTEVHSPIAGKNVTISLDCCIFAKATKAAFINDRKLIAGEAKNASSTWPVNWRVQGKALIQLEFGASERITNEKRPCVGEDVLGYGAARSVADRVAELS